MWQSSCQWNRSRKDGGIATSLLKKKSFALSVFFFPSHLLEYTCGTESASTVQNTVKDGSREPRSKALGPWVIFMEQNNSTAWTTDFQTVPWERQTSTLLVCLILGSLGMVVSSLYLAYLHQTLQGGKQDCRKPELERIHILLYFSILCYIHIFPSY